MTKSEIVYGLIELYEEGLNAVSDAHTNEQAFVICCEYGIQQGVCTAMARLFGKSSKDMIENYLLMADDFKQYLDIGSRWWGDPPQNCNFTVDIISALEYRLTILKEILCKF